MMQPMQPGARDRVGNGIRNALLAVAAFVIAVLLLCIGVACGPYDDDDGRESVERPAYAAVTP